MASRTKRGARRSVPAYRITLTRERADGGANQWLAQVDELPSCSATGPTPDAAAAAAERAIEAWIDQARAEGRDVPEPGGAAYSGRLLLRMPRSLHADLARRADREGVSLNQWIVGALARSVGAAAEPPGGEGLAASPPRSLRAALLVNLVVVGVVAAAGIALLVIALFDRL